MRLKGQETSLLLLLAVAVTAGVAGGPSADTRAGRLDDWRAVEDSLRTMHPRYRARWLRGHGLGDRLPDFISSTDSGPLRVVGRWSHGPSYDIDCRVTGTDTLIALGRGSGVSLLSFNRTLTPRVEFLSDVNGERLLNQVMFRDTLLYVGTNAGLEVYDIADTRNPERLSWIRTGCAGFDIKDSLAFITWYDTFKVYSIADPANPYRVGWCRDSGATVSVVGGTAYLADWGGLYAVDVRDPSSPHRVGSWGNNIWCAQARGNICCLSRGGPDGLDLRFVILDVSDPENMRELGTALNAGGEDIHLDGSRAYAAGYYTPRPWFQLIDISDTLHPQVMGRCTLEGYKHGAWGKVGLDRALVANDLDGLVLVDISNPSDPAVDSLLLGGGYTLDIELNETRVYVANGGGGMKVLDVSDPTRSTLLGSYDTPGWEDECYSVAAQDSFAYIGWFNFPPFRTIDVSDPTRPRLAGVCDAFEYAQDMELRDTLVFCADNYKLEVINVARPREPQVVGTLNLPERTRGLFVRDTFAYVAQGYTGLVILSIAQPETPRELGRYVSVRSTHGVWVEDTVAYIAELDSGLTVISVADPQACRKLGSHLTPAWAYDVLVVDSVAYLACRDGIRVFDVSDPTQPVEVGFHSTPYLAWRLEYGAPYLYAACYDAGVCLFERCSTGVSERPPTQTRDRDAVEVLPNPARALVVVRTGRLTAPGWLAVRDVTGRKVRGVRLRAGPEAQSVRLDVRGLPAGLYFVEVVSAGSVKRGRFVKQR